MTASVYEFTAPNGLPYTIETHHEVYDQDGELVGVFPTPTEAEQAANSHAESVRWLEAHG